ncbi:MAG: hypothetical protein AB8F26_00305 [Phycisphaerales bacterium]
MIPFFVGYAFLVWFLTARFRRTFYAYIVIALGVGFLLLLTYLHSLLGRIDPELARQGVQILLYPYTAMVGAMSLFISAMPRRHPPGICGRCGYDLFGLGHPVDRCPECGQVSPPKPPVHRPSGVQRENLRSSDVGRSASQPAEAGTGQQDHAGYNTEQHPSD